MNFPGLDPAWTAAYRAAHLCGFIPTWTLDETRPAVADGAKVLVVATTALGDSLLTTPLIEALSTTLGRERVSLLVKRPYAEIYRDDPRLSHVFTVRGKFRFGNLRARLRADPHVVALLANMTEPDLIPYLYRCGVRSFLRYRSRWTRFSNWIANREMLRKPGDADYATGHAIENNLAMAATLGIEAASRQLSLPHLRRESEPKSGLVVIHPGASREIKRWPLENWIHLADRIIQKYDRGVVITGDGSERQPALAIKAVMKSGTRAQVVAGQLSLLELAKMQARALAFISGDTGPYHLAVAVGCPTVTLFAPTDRGSSIEACGPHQAPARYHRALSTRKFGDRIETISVDRVWEETWPLLEK